jgi:hypothetical protein
MQTEFHRISRLPPYVFEQVNKLKAEARARGEDIIDFGMGNPDMPTPAAYRRETDRDGARSALEPLFRSRGIKGLRRAMAAYYQRRFGVELDPDTEVIATLGSKEGFANLAQAITGARRRGFGAESGLSDSCLRFHPSGAPRSAMCLRPRRRNSWRAPRRLFTFRSLRRWRWW